MQQEPEFNVIAKFMRCWFLMLTLALLLLAEHIGHFLQDRETDDDHGLVQAGIRR